MISTSKLNVRYAETDQMGIVHHSVYAVWYEVARTDFCKAAGLPYKEMEKAGVLTPLVSLNCKFIKPAFYDDTLEITSIISIEHTSSLGHFTLYNLSNSSIADFLTPSIFPYIIFSPQINHSLNYIH